MTTTTKRCVQVTVAWGKFQKVGGHGSHARLDVEQARHDLKPLKNNITVYCPTVGEPRLQEVGI